MASTIDTWYYSIFSILISSNYSYRIQEHTLFSFSRISLIGRCAAFTHKFCNEKNLTCVNSWCYKVVIQHKPKNQTFRSLPEYPSVMFAIESRSTSEDKSSLANITFRIFSLLAASGKLTINLWTTQNRNTKLEIMDALWLQLSFRQFMSQIN